MRKRVAAESSREHGLVTAVVLGDSERAAHFTPGRPQTPNPLSPFSLLLQMRILTSVRH